MKIQNISSMSFGACIPVYYMARNPKNNKYVPVIKKENIRKCNSYIVRNLNGTLKNPNDEFISQYENTDKDYKKINYVSSFYDDSAKVYLITGSDAQTLDEEGLNIGIAQSQSLDAIGTTKTFEVKYAKQSYAKKVKLYIDRIFKHVKSEEGENLALVAYFEPKYKKTGELKGFEFKDSEFRKEEQVKFIDEWVKNHEDNTKK